MNLPANLLSESGLDVYPNSVRTLADGRRLFVARRGKRKVVVTLYNGTLQVEPLTWGYYQQLRKMLPLTPVCCEHNLSFGTGDRLGMVTAAHLSALKEFDVFPVIAQQSPRELRKTGRTFQDVLLDAVMGLLESGFTGNFGADADHVKDEESLVDALNAGYSMYTVDISGWLSHSSCLNETSKRIVSRYAGKPFFSVRGSQFTPTEEGLLRAAFFYQSALEKLKQMNNLVSERMHSFDLEISVDEGANETSLEDHVYIAEYLHSCGIEFTSLAPKFPGRFEKGIDYQGDVNKLRNSFSSHARLCRMLGGYRLSLHSGSDKFSIYPMFHHETEGCLHIKTSGTTWLQAIGIIAKKDEPLFRVLYTLCLANLDESKEAYDISIETEQFPAEPPADIRSFLDRPDVRQLFHISYGALLREFGDEIRCVLREHEDEHYSAVQENIKQHLAVLTA